MLGFLGPDLASLMSLDRGEKRDLRSVILRVQTDLFVSAPARDPRAIEAFEALATGLLPTVDDSTAAGIARQLAPLADTPERVIACLARRGGAARDAILALAPDLSSAVLEAASAAGDDLGPILASRAGLDPALLAALVMRQDEAVDIVLARNLALVLPPQLLETLVSRGRTRSSLARSLLAREDLTAADLAPLYLHAEPARRAWIRTGLAGIASLRGTASLLSRPDPASCNRLVALAAAGEIQAFERALAELLGLGSALSWDLGREQRHELLALALLALGVSEEDSVRVFLTLQETIARSVRTVFHLTQIVRSTPRTTAIHLVEATLGAATSLRLARRHVPHLSPGDAARGIPLQGAERRTVQDRSRRAS